MESAAIFRDYSKILLTRNYYTGSNDVIKSNPHLHGSAIYLGLKSEKASRLLEAILYTRVDQVITNDQWLSLASDRYKHALVGQDKSYAYEQ